MENPILFLSMFCYSTYRAIGVTSLDNGEENCNIGGFVIQFILCLDPGLQLFVCIQRCLFWTAEARTLSFFKICVIYKDSHTENLNMFHCQW